MGMFDTLHCDYPLPVRKAAQGIEFQTKSLDNALDNLHIRADGTLWRQEYDIEDHSDPTAATPVGRLAGSLTRVNKHWEPMADFSGPIEFHGGYGTRRKGGWYDGFVRLEADIERGRVVAVRLLEEQVSPSVLAEETAQQLEAQTPGGALESGHKPRL